MSNDYYNHGSVPINRSLAQSALIRTEFDAVMAGFAKLPALTGNAYKPVIVNAAGDALGVAGWKVYGGFNDTSSVAVGTSALALASTGGIQNTAIGAYAMSAGVVSSFNNVAIGYQSLYSATTAQSNTAVGAVTLKANTTGNGNTAIGNGAMFQSVSGNSNTAVGGGSMNDRTSGDGNVAVGSASLYANVNGANNTAVGYLAARYFTGSGITAVGYQACNATVTGTRNTAVGYEALLVDTGYGYNTAIGWNALKANTSGGANTAVGSQALGSNTTGDLNVSVGQTSMVNNTTGANNTAVGNAAMANNDSGSNNTAVGSAAGLNFNTTDNNTAIGVDSGLTAGTETNTTTIGYQAVATASNQVVLGNASVTETILRGQVKGGAGTGAGQPVMVGTLSVNTTPVGNVGGGEDNLMTYTLPANSLSANGKGVRVKMWGYTSSNANVKQVNFYFGSEFLQGFAPTINELNYWTVEIIMVRYAVAVQTKYIHTTSINNNVVALADISVGSASEDETGAILIRATGQGTDNDDIVQSGMIVEFFN